MKTRLSAAEKKKFLQRQKKIAAIKTSIPLVLTLSLFLILYILVLRPEEPQNILKSAVLNSIDPSKYSSVRYDGSFGDTNRGMRLEFSGQKITSGDQEFRIRLYNDDIDSSVESMRVNNVGYIKISGSENLKTLTSNVTGLKVPDDELIKVLSEIQNKWVSVDVATLSTLSNKQTCVDKLPSLGANTQKSMDESNYPFIYKSGPASPKDDSGDQVYEVELNNSATQGLYNPVIEFINCLDTSYGVDDFRLRNANEADVESAKITVQLNPVSNRVTNILVKQVGVYFKINFKDYNKDVSLYAPSDFKTPKEIFTGLSNESVDYLTRQSFLLP